MPDKLTEEDIQRAKNAIRRRKNFVGKKPNMTRSETDKRVYAETGLRKKDNSRKRKILKSRLDERRQELNRRNNMLIRAKKNTQKIEKPSASMMMDTTTSAYGDAGKGRPVPKFKEGGYCRGVGAAIKGTKFEGVF
jgi:hypothetical protein